MYMHIEKKNIHKYVWVRAIRICDCLIYQSSDPIVDAHPKSPAANSRAFY